MSDVWSRAWCETQNVPNFALKGLTPSNEIRDPPKYIRSVFSEPIDDETFYTEYNKEFGPEESETRCFQIWEKTKKRISKGGSGTMCNSSRSSLHGTNQVVSNSPRSRYNREKQPNFISDNWVQGVSRLSSNTTPPLSPGRVRVSRTYGEASMRSNSTISSLTPPSPVFRHLSTSVCSEKHVINNSLQQSQQQLYQQPPSHHNQEVSVKPKKKGQTDNVKDSQAADNTNSPNVSFRKTSNLLSSDTKPLLPHTPNGDKLFMSQVSGPGLAEGVRLVKIIFVAHDGQIIAQSNLVRDLHDCDNVVVKQVGWS